MRDSVARECKPALKLVPWFKQTAVPIQVFSPTYLTTMGVPTQERKKESDCCSHFQNLLCWKFLKTCNFLTLLRDLKLQVKKTLAHLLLLLRIVGVECFLQSQSVNHKMSGISYLEFLRTDRRRGRDHECCRICRSEKQCAVSLKRSPASDTGSNERAGKQSPSRFT